MDDAEVLPARVLLAVRVVEPLADLRGEEDGLGRGHDLLAAPVALQERAQVPAGDVLHRDEVRVLVLPELVDVHDVGVVQLDADPRLVDEHRDELFVLRHRREDLLDGEDPLEALDAEGLGREDLRHATDVDALEEEVLPKEVGFFIAWIRPHPEGH